LPTQTPLASAYRVAAGSDLQSYRGKRVQVVGTIMSAGVAAAPGAAATTSAPATASADAPQMRIESIRVISGDCKAR